jgi:hypothetical protein
MTISETTLSMMAFTIIGLFATLSIYIRAQCYKTLYVLNLRIFIKS